EMNRLFDNLVTSNNSQEGIGLGFVPRAELVENGDSYTLRLELPGMDVKDLDIQATAEAVSISGERKTERQSEENGVTRSEFRYGKFQRVIPLPGRINHQDVGANYQDGILSLTLPKADEEKNKVVRINLG
ncbi:Hsp20/alpha crystallin family protein, partial [Candidatus Synechococcus calcipolaris G9]